MRGTHIDSRVPDRRAGLRTLVLNLGAPLATYAVLGRQGVPTVAALVAASVFPTAAIGLAVVQRRRIDVLGALSLTAIVFGIVAGVVLRDPRILVAKESLVTGALGLASLASLLTSRPLVLVVASRFAPMLLTSADHVTRARLLTLIWAIALLADAGMRVVLAFTLRPGLVLVLSPLLAVAILGPLTVWTLRELQRPSRQPAAAI